MTGTICKSSRGLTASVSVLAMIVSPIAGAALDDLVFIKGRSTESQFAMAQNQSGTNEIDFEQACIEANQLIFGAAVSTPPSVLSYVFGFEPGLGDIPLLDCSEAQPSQDRYVILFSTCSMMMTDGIHTMYWTVPPEASEAQMVIVDAQSKEFIAGSLLETDMENVASFAKGREIRQTVNPASGNRDYEIQLEIGPTGNYTTSIATFTGRAYSFEYEGEFGVPGMRELGLPMNKMQSTGTAWLSPDVPGSDVVAAFYENFKNHVTPATGSGTLFTAMIEQMADVVQNGMPLETKQTVKTSMPMGGLGGVAASRIGQGSTSTSEIEAITVWQGAASEHEVCGHLEAPAGYTTTSMAEMSAGYSASPEDMQELQEAMQNITPEQRQMMEQMGVGNMMEQMMGGRIQGAQPPAANPRAAKGSPGSNMPSSADLQGGSVTESVQKHLQALGYDVGEANGEMSLETTIAISTFQAEKGMDVTGEVSPQLLGILSAEVDKRR